MSKTFVTVKHPHVIGCGESHFAVLAAEPAFMSIAELPTRAQSAMSFSRCGVAHFGLLGFRAARCCQRCGWRVGLVEFTRVIEGALRARGSRRCNFAVTGGAQMPISCGLLMLCQH
ncbi:MAG: hypothetical protein NZL91_05395 [Thermoflexales bacterium]|nr:hypothetical protein [Thermoflexales bacterium]MDW8054931.1 hypothetical protein [Anaerolineae bacterium]MDW8396398.1 hypothetical protein [Anaerolineae bacterium]